MLDGWRRSARCSTILVLCRACCGLASAESQRPAYPRPGRTALLQGYDREFAIQPIPASGKVLMASSIAAAVGKLRDQMGIVRSGETVQGKPLFSAPASPCTPSISSPLTSKHEIYTWLQANNYSLHALYDVSSKTFCYVVFDPGGATWPSRGPLEEASAPCFVMIRETDSGLAVSLAQIDKNLDTIRLQLAGRRKLLDDPQGVRATPVGARTAIDISTPDHTPRVFRVE